MANQMILKNSQKEIRNTTAQTMAEVINLVVLSVIKLTNRSTRFFINQNYKFFGTYS